MKEKIQEFDITAKFSIDLNTVVEAKTEEEAKKIATKYISDFLKDHLRDKNNIKMTIKSKHTISEEERKKLEEEGIIEPRKLTERQKARLEKKKARAAFAERQSKEVASRKRSKKSK